MVLPTPRVLEVFLGANPVGSGGLSFVSTAAKGVGPLERSPWNISTTMAKSSEP
jgi:hypothetical protein